MRTSPQSFNKRFEVESYEIITKAMDLFDLTDEQIQQVSAKVSLVGISSDWLFPTSDVRNLAKRFKRNGVRTEYFEIVSEDGHDAFLSDVAETSRVLKEILATNKHEQARKEIEKKYFDDSFIIAKNKQIKSAISCF